MVMMIISSIEVNAESVIDKRCDMLKSDNFVTPEFRQTWSPNDHISQPPKLKLNAPDCL